MLLGLPHVLGCVSLYIQAKTKPGSLLEKGDSSVGLCHKGFVKIFWVLGTERKMYLMLGIDRSGFYAEEWEKWVAGRSM